MSELPEYRSSKELLADAKQWDAQCAETWFTGPLSATARAMRHRRALLAEIERLQQEVAIYKGRDDGKQLVINQLERAAEPPSEWQPIETAPRDREALFWVVPLSAEETHRDRSGNPILSAATPGPMLCRYGRWSSLSKATHWIPLRPPTTKSGAPAQSARRLQIELRIIDSMLEPGYEAGAIDVEYWTPLHDKLQACLTELQDRSIVASEFVVKCVEAVGRDPNVESVDLVELADRVTRCINVAAETRTSEPPNAGLASISMEPRGSKVAVIHCFDSMAQAQAWRDGLSPTKPEAPPTSTNDHQYQASEKEGNQAEPPSTGR